MKSENLIKKLEKEGFKVIDFSREIRGFITNQKALIKEYAAKGVKYGVHWYDQEGKAVCVHIKKLEDETDSQRDHFPGWFCDTIKEVINDLKKV